MERKTKHRILGFFVVVGLTIILLPLFQSANVPATDTKLVKAPPFPDQSVQVATSAPIEASSEPTLIPIKPAQTADNTAEQQPDDVIRNIRPSIINDKMETPVTPAEPEAAIANTNTVAEDSVPNLGSEEDDFQVAKTSTDKPIVKSKAVKSANLATKKTIKLAKQTTTHRALPSNKAITDNGLLELKNAVWVIQIGSFKNKTNALRVVNQLRANGYRAFIQQISTTFGENTRVFVGPEYKRNAATQLATRLENHMHIRGIVISYKPLAL